MCYVHPQLRKTFSKHMGELSEKWKDRAKSPSLADSCGGWLGKSWIQGEVTCPGVAEGAGDQVSHL